MRRKVIQTWVGETGSRLQVGIPRLLARIVVAWLLCLPGFGLALKQGLGAAPVLPQPAPRYTSQSGFCSIGSRFTLVSVNTTTSTDTTNRFVNSRLGCLVYVSGSRVRICYALVAPNTTRPVVCETPTDGATIRCALENPSGTILQAMPEWGTVGGSDQMSIVAAPGQLVWFDVVVPATQGQYWWVRTFADKGVATNALPLNINLSAYTSNPGLSPYEVWGDGYYNSSVDCTAGGSVSAVSGGISLATFGPCAVGIVPLNPYNKGCATFALEDDSTGRGQTDADSWRGGWAGREAIMRHRPFMNLSCPGEASTCATTDQFAVRSALIQMFAHNVIVGYGINDLSIWGASAASEVIANRLTLARWAVQSGCTASALTIWPCATSTDYWSSIANETVNSWEEGRLAINEDARLPGTLGVYNAPVVDVESYLAIQNETGIVPNVCVPNALIWATGCIAATAGGTIAPMATQLGPFGSVLVNGEAVALSGLDPQSPNYGNFSGGTVIVMTTGLAAGQVFPVAGNNWALFGVLDLGNDLALVAPGDSFDLVYQLCANPHMPARQQMALAANCPMHHALGY